MKAGITRPKISFLDGCNEEKDAELSLPVYRTAFPQLRRPFDVVLSSPHPTRRRYRLLKIPEPYGSEQIEEATALDLRSARPLFRAVNSTPP